MCVRIVYVTLVIQQPTPFFSQHNAVKEKEVKLEIVILNVV